MDDLIDDHPLTGGGKTTFELINNYLPILMGNYVNRRLTCGGKSGPHYCKISSNMHFCVIIGPNLKKIQFTCIICTHTFTFQWKRCPSWCDVITFPVCCDISRSLIAAVAVIMINWPWPCTADVILSRGLEGNVRQWRNWGGSCAQVQQARGHKTAWPKIFYD